MSNPLKYHRLLSRTFLLVYSACFGLAALGFYFYSGLREDRWLVYSIFAANAVVLALNLPPDTQRSRHMIIPSLIYLLFVIVGVAVVVLLIRDSVSSMREVVGQAIVIYGLSMLAVQLYRLIKQKRQQIRR
jgi:hypothetical protein